MTARSDRFRDGGSDRDRIRNRSRWQRQNQRQVQSETSRVCAPVLRKVRKSERAVFQRSASGSVSRGGAPWVADLGRGTPRRRERILDVGRGPPAERSTAHPGGTPRPKADSHSRAGLWEKVPPDGPSRSKDADSGTTRLNLRLSDLLSAGAIGPASPQATPWRSSFSPRSRTKPEQPESEHASKPQHPDFRTHPHR